MARRPRTLLDDQLERWARWCIEGRAAPQSMIAKAIDNHGLLQFGGGGSVPVVDIESTIEAAVLKVSERDVLAADVLRLEYQAGVSAVCRRRGIRGYDWRAGQAEKAELLGISVRTYARKLTVMREAVAVALQAIQ